MKILITLVAVLLMSGCSFFKQAGVADYEMEPVVVDGQVHCCKVSVYNTKDIGMVDVVFQKKGDTITVKLTELEVDSSGPAMIQAETTGKMVDTVSDLIKLIPAVPEVAP